MRGAVSRISVEGFKSIRELKDFDLGEVNVIVGANGSGKSNFIQTDLSPAYGDDAKKSAEVRPGKRRRR